MKTSVLRFLPVLLTVLIIGSCSKGDGTDSPNDNKPKITIISPKGQVNSGDDIEVEVNFTDNNGLKEVEIRLGNLNIAGNVYDVVQRGLTGKSDQLKYSFKVPASLNVVGTNYIYVKCTDIDGNETIADEDFDIIDLVAPTLTIVNVDDIDVYAGSGGYFYIDYKVADNAGVVYSAAELWETDAAGNLLTQKDIDDLNYSNPPTTPTIVSASLRTGWVTGQNYKAVLKARDAAGNLAETSVKFIAF